MGMFPNIFLFSFVHDNLLLIEIEMNGIGLHSAVPYFTACGFILVVFNL